MVFFLEKWLLIIMPLVYVNYIKTSSHVEPFFNIDLEAVILVSAKRRFTHTLDTVAFSVSKKMYPLKPPLWYFPWDGAIFSKRVIKVVVVCWHRIALRLKIQCKTKFIIYTLQKGVWWPELIMCLISGRRRREKWGRAVPWLCFHLAYEREVKVFPSYH